MKRLFIFLLFLAFETGSNHAQELIGPETVRPGTLAVYEIVPPQQADWFVTPSVDAESRFQVDTSGTKLYFADLREGAVTVVAAIQLDGKPKLLHLSVTVSGDSPQPGPSPTPPVTPLATWIKARLPVSVESKNLDAERKIVARCFSDVAEMIESRDITTPQNTKAQLKIRTVGALARASKTAVSEWSGFLGELSVKLESELGSKSNDISELKTVFRTVANTLEEMK